MITPITALQQSPLFGLLQPVLAAIINAGGRPLLVGGAVRDVLLGFAPKDIDIEVYGLAAEVLADVLASFGKVNAVGRSFGVLKLRLPSGDDVDVALPRRENKIGAGHRGFLVAPDPTMTPEEAALRRDFTINAMALTPDGTLIDPTSGAEDLRRRVLRHTSPAFAEDPLRVLRGMQFAARFGLRMAPETVALCRSLLPEADTLSVERVWGEWAKWAQKSTDPAAGLLVLQETGWLPPELQPLIGCKQEPRYHPEGDVWIHTTLVCNAAAHIADRDGLGANDRQIVLFAALCHDLGKPATTVYTANGIRSPGHAIAGLEPTRAFLRRIGAPNAVGEYVLPLIREHMVHIGMQVTAAAVRRLSVRLKPATVGQWGQVVEADHSGRPPLPPGQPAQAILDMAHNLDVAAQAPQPLLTGRHLISIGFAAGPTLGAILREAYQAQIDGAFATPDEADHWLERQGLIPTNHST